MVELRGIELEGRAWIDEVDEEATRSLPGAGTSRNARVGATRLVRTLLASMRPSH
jgi:hypothetical protein